MRSVIAFLLAVGMATAAPLRVALLDFDNMAVATDVAELGGVTPEVLAAKGLPLLTASLVNRPEFVLVDRRDFIRRLQPVAPDDDVHYQPSFLQAAQAVNADLVLRGALLSYAPGRQVVNLGGIRTEFAILSLRVSLEALDTFDGTVVAAVDGAARKEFRQTASLSEFIGEDDLLELMRSAIDKAMPELQRSLQARQAQQQARPRIKLSITTSADPALVEINGLLVGTTPLKDFEIYAGDHVLTLGKAGYQDVSRRVQLSADTVIEVPLIRTKLSADELKEILEKSRLNIVSGVPEPAFSIHQIDLDVQNK